VREPVLLAIAGMALVTYATRISGLFLGRRVPVPPWLERLLTAMPGAILVSLVAPAIVDAGIAGVVAALAAVLAALLVPDNLLVPMGVGVAVDVGMRLLR
jgi:uncharacterized membrane protein